MRGIRGDQTIKNGDSEQGEAERTDSAISDALVDGGFDWGLRIFQKRKSNKCPSGRSKSRKRNGWRKMLGMYAVRSLRIHQE